MTQETDVDAVFADPFAGMTEAKLRRRSSLKWMQHPPDVLPLWVAEMDVATSPPVARAVIEAMERGDTGYINGGTSYAEAVAAFAADRWGWDGLDVSRTAVVPDVMLGVVEVLHLVSSPGDAVVVCSPVYPPFYAFAVRTGRVVIEAPNGGDQRIDLAAVESAFVAARAHGRHPVLLLCNPHNPTGVVHTPKELAAVATLAQEHGVRVVSDEIHAPLVLPGATFTPYLSVPGSEDAFALLSATKGWNLAGLKAALLVAGPDAGQDLARMPEEVSHGPSHLGVIAHTAAFSAGRGWLDGLLTALDRRRALVQELANDRLPGVSVVRPEATYLSWMDCRQLGLHGPPRQSKELGVVTDLSGPAQFFLDQARVALSSGHVFGSGGNGFVRLNFATTPEILIEAIDRMSTALDRR